MLNNSKMSGGQDNLMTKFTHALNSPIHNRCAELTVLIDRCSSKDLQNLFPTLMESIFGTSGGLSWGLRNITSTSHPQDFVTLHHFLGPLGPVFRLIYKLLTDTQVKYEYSVTHLPQKVRLYLENSKIPPFYSDLLNVDPQTRSVHSLSLNAFDYYMFHFAYHLTNPWQQRVRNAWSVWNTVYYVLSCDYILHFLPTDPNVVILPQLVHFTGKNPTIIPPQSVTSRPQSTPKLFRTHVLQQSTADISALHQPMQQHPRGEIWRSETVVQVFIDTWLYNDQLNTVETSFNPQSKVNELPTGEYIRIIRVLVKQLHAFSASGRNDATHLGELKKIVQPMLQGPIYAFLRHLVYRWPLDGSFRLVLELWLSFIQPWRYLAGNQIKMQDNEIDDPHAPNTKFVDQHYLGFIADNLLAYTVIFQQLLPRFSRIDIASPKNALMLFRVCKVFGQPDLVPMIRDIESCIENLNHSPTHSYHTAWSSNLPPLSPTSCWSTNTSYNASTNLNLSANEYHSAHNTSIPLKPNSPHSHSFNQSTYQTPRINVLNNKWAAIVRHRIYEWEGPEFCYKPMFTRNAAPEVYQLLKQIHLAEQVANDIVQKRMEETKSQYGNLFGTFFKSLFSESDSSADEFSLEDRKKAPVYLSMSKQYLMEIFKLDLSLLEQSQNSLNTSMNQSFDDTASLNDSLPHNIDFSPTSVKLRAKNLKYQGDPDLHPIRSNENAFLVRVLYHLAQKINETYSVQFRNTYYRDDFLGKVCKQILCPPTLTYSYDKSVPGFSPRVQKMLPPRLSLRYCASHSFLGYLLIGFLFLRYLGYGTFSFIVIVFVLWAVYILLKALLDYRNTNNVSTNLYTNDFNDSF